MTRSEETAQADDVSIAIEWTAPGRGQWRRDIRLGEWLTEPVTPLFATWFLPAVDRRFRETQAKLSGVVLPRPAYAIVNGWYYHSPLGDRRSSVLVRGLVLQPRFAVGMMFGRRRPWVTHRLVLSHEIDRLELVLNRYRVAVAAVESGIAGNAEAQLFRSMSTLLEIVGDYTWSLTILGGAAWRTENALTRYFDKVIRPTLDESPLRLLGDKCGDRGVASHAVWTLDWVHPTIGELVAGGNPEPPPRRHLANEHSDLEFRSRQVLVGRPRCLRRFNRLLELCHESADRRALYTAEFTLGWPVMRRAIHHFGEILRDRGCVADRDDVFFLRRSEILEAVSGNVRLRFHDRVAERRTIWAKQRSLRPPLAIGVQACLLPLLVPTRGAPDGSVDPGVLQGTGVSPGRATGRARILDGAGTNDSFRDGEILIVRAFVPALASLLARAGGVASDTGSMAAHTSVLAREYGVPGVVGLETVTRTVQEGEIVTIDGFEGLVRIHQRT